MEPLLDVISVVPQEDCTLLLTFENNERRIMVPYLGKKPYLRLKNLPLFVKTRMISAAKAVCCSGCGWAAPCMWSARRKMNIWL